MAWRCVTIRNRIVANIPNIACATRIEAVNDHDAKTRKPDTTSRVATQNFGALPDVHAAINDGITASKARAITSGPAPGRVASVERIWR